MIRQHDDEPGLHNAEEDRDGALRSPPEPKDQPYQQPHQRPEEQQGRPDQKERQQDSDSSNREQG